MPRLVTGSKSGSSAVTTASGSSTQLSAEVRLRKAISEFRAELGDGDEKIRFDALIQDASPEASDVFKLAEEINQKGKSDHKSWKPYGTRLQSMLSNVQTLAVVGDSITAGSRNPLTNGAWATVRLSMLISVTYLALFEKVSAMLMQVGQAAAIHRDLVRLFTSDETLHDISTEYLIVVVELCRYFIQFKAKNMLSRYVATLAMTKQFQEAEDRLVMWAGLINGRVQYLQSQVAVETKKQVSLLRGVQALWDSKKKLETDTTHCYELLKYLCPHQDELDQSWIRARRKGTIDWIFNTSRFQNWAGAWSFDSAGYRTLVLKGGLGRGKTVLMANIVSRLLQNKENIVIPVFCHRTSTPTLNPEILLASIAQQMARGVIHALKQDSGSHKDSYQEACSFYADIKHAKDPETLLKVTRRSQIYAQRIDMKFYVVVDGLDNLQESDAEHLTSTLLKEWMLTAGEWISNTTLGAVPLAPNVFLCVSLRTGSEIMSHVSDRHELNIGGDEHSSELEGFISSELHSRHDFMALTSATQELIIQTISSLADGWFLWASLQIDQLFPNHSRKVPSENDILGLVSTLPMGLNDIFSRAMQEIKYWSDQPNIFSLVIGAKRPLKFSEIMVALRTDTASGDIGELAQDSNPAATIYSCSGGLLELDEEFHTVHFVHSSVYQYLIGNHTFPGTCASWCFSDDSSDLLWGKICLAYLDSSIHERQLIKAEQGLRVTDSMALDTISKSIGESSSLAKFANRVARYSHSSKGSVPKVDILKVAEKYAEERRKNHRRNGRAVLPESLLEYAQRFWLEHSDHFLEGVTSPLEEDPLEARFLKVLRGISTAKSSLPFPTNDMFTIPVRKVIQDSENPLSHPTELRVNTLKGILQWVYDHQHLRLLFHVLYIIDRWRDWEDTLGQPTVVRNAAERKDAIYNMRETLLDCSAEKIRWNVDVPDFVQQHLPFISTTELAEGQIQAMVDAPGLINLLTSPKSEFSSLIRHQMSLAYLGPISESWDLSSVAKTVRHDLYQQHTWKFGASEHAFAAQITQMMGYIGSLCIRADEKPPRVAGLPALQVHEDYEPQIFRWLMFGLKLKPCEDEIPSLWLALRQLSDVQFRQSLPNLRSALTKLFEGSGRDEVSRTHFSEIRILTLLINARVPCHHQNSVGESLAFLVLDSWDSQLLRQLQSYCTSCAYDDHMPFIWLVAIEYGEFDFVVQLFKRSRALGRRGYTGLTNEIFLGDKKRLVRVERGILVNLSTGRFEQSIDELNLEGANLRVSHCFSKTYVDQSRGLFVFDGDNADDLLEAEGLYIQSSNVLA